MAGELTIKKNTDPFTDYTPTPGMAKNGAVPNQNQTYGINGSGFGPNNETNLGTIANEQSDAASKFYDQLPYYSKDQANLAQEQAMSQQAQNAKGINRNYNQRGLLYSGLNAGEQAGNQVNTANSLAQQIAQNNIGNMQNYQTMAGQGMGSQAGVYNLQTSNQWLAYQKALADAQAKQQGLQSIIGGGAGLLGMGLAAL